MPPRDLTGNAADKDQVAFARRKERDEQAAARAALKLVMQTVTGRRVLTDILRRARVYESIYEASARIYYNAGRQDMGHELIAALVDADEELYGLMESEYRGRQAALAREIAAARTPRAETGGTT